MGFDHLSRNEYEKLEGIGGDDSTNKHSRPRLRERFKPLSEKTKRDLKDAFGNTLAGTFGTIITASPLIITLGCALLFVDQDKQDDHKKQYFKLPPTAVEVANPPANSRQFALIAKEAVRLMCPDSYIRHNRLGTSNQVLPVSRDESILPSDKIIIAGNDFRTNTMPDRLITCSYPDSDPNEIMHIPVVRVGE